MFFDLGDDTTPVRTVVTPTCIDPTEPQVDNSSIECDELISTNCVVTAKGYPYLGIGYQETLTSVLEKIKNRFKSISFTISNLGTGIGILKNFSGSVLSAKTIQQGTGIVITEANDTITINATGGGSGGGGVIDVTHTNLVSFKNAGTLSPGTFYRITDFRTMYDQPDFDSAGSAKTSVVSKQGPIEPITVFAISSDTLSQRAYQEDHPLDVIDYILEFTTPVNNTVTKGRIIYRKDEFGNETDFDHKNVLFKRYLQADLTKNLSHKDTTLTFVEVPMIPTSVASRNIKSVGYFSAFQAGIFSDFDLPNNVITVPSIDSTFGIYVYNSTFKNVSSSVIDYCEGSIFDVNISSSKIRQVVDSVLYSVGNDISINLSEIDEINNSFVGTQGITKSKIGKISSCNIGNLDINSSNISMYLVGTFPLSGLPLDTVNISLSTVDLTSVVGNFTIHNSYLSAIDSMSFLTNSISNVRGGGMSSCVMKSNQTILNLNILGFIQGVNFSSSNIIFNTALSKEVIKHPSGLYIKHYDQFGAAIINNVNA